MKNHHQGLYMATSDVLKAWKIRCGFDVPSNRPGRKANLLYSVSTETIDVVIVERTLGGLLLIRWGYANPIRLRNPHAHGGRNCDRRSFLYQPGLRFTREILGRGLGAHYNLKVESSTVVRQNVDASQESVEIRMCLLSAGTSTRANALIWDCPFLCPTENIT
jgi:hypothetical protein